MMLEAGDYRLDWKWHLTDFPRLAVSGALLNEAEPELIFYDAYSPARCPSMWELEHWRRLRALCGKKRPCEIAFHSRSTALRVTLLLAGFFAGAGVAIGEKDETTVAATEPGLLKKPFDRDWLGKVRRSTSARPFNGSNTGGGAISEEDYAVLVSHPQFVG